MNARKVLINLCFGVLFIIIRKAGIIVSFLKMPLKEDFGENHYRVER